MSHGINVVLDKSLVNDVRSGSFESAEGQGFKSLLEEFRATVRPLMPKATSGDVVRFFWVDGVEEGRQEEFVQKVTRLPKVQSATLPARQHAMR